MLTSCHSTSPEFTRDAMEKTHADAASEALSEFLIFDQLPIELRLKICKSVLSPRPLICAMVPRHSIRT